MADQTQGIRWGRALLAAVLVEVLLAIVAVPALMWSDSPNATMNAIVPPAAFILAASVVAWLFRNAARPIANGVATGLSAIALYVVLGGGAHLIAPDQADFSQSLSLPYLASHLLKILGGAAGGWWIARKRVAGTTFD